MKCQAPMMHSDEVFAACDQPQLRLDRVRAVGHVERTFDRTGRRDRLA